MEQRIICFTLTVTVIFGCSLVWANQMDHQQYQQQLQHGHHDGGFLDKQDIEHIRHDVKDQYYVELDKDKVNEEELDFYNFKLHDFDNNLMLDGLELLVGLNHDEKFTPSEQTGQQPTPGEQQNYWHNKFDNDAQVVDHILDYYDNDKDGYISFHEYKKVRSSIK